MRLALVAAGEGMHQHLHVTPRQRPANVAPGETVRQQVVLDGLTVLGVQLQEAEDSPTGTTADDGA